MDDRAAQDDLVDCAVIIVTYNSGEHLDELLSSLELAAAGRSVRTIVVDNGSSDATLQIAAARSSVRLVESGRNLGYAGGINLGREHGGRRRSILVLNPDLRLEAGSIDRLLTAQAATGAGVVFAQLVDDEGEVLRSIRRDPSLTRALGDALFGDHLRTRPGWATESVNDAAAYDRAHAIDWATGAALLVSDECDRVVGAWDESFFMYSEEVDYAIRARTAGFAAVFEPTARAAHAEGGSGRSIDLTALLALNRVRLYAKYHSRGATVAFRVVVVLHELMRFWSRERRHSAAVVAGFAPPPVFDRASPIERVAW